ncbi:hypothetical protein Aperf_G00000030035 [Anoplocephala perfoliata]
MNGSTKDINALRHFRRSSNNYINPITVYTPLIPQLPQVYFLIGYVLIIGIFILTILIAAFVLNKEVRKYYRDRSQKLRFWGPSNVNHLPVISYTSNELLKDPEILNDEKPSRRDVIEKVEEQPPDVFVHMPVSSETNNFIRHGSTVSMHLAFAHDLASFISMVDGKI